MRKKIKNKQVKIPEELPLDEPKLEPLKLPLELKLKEPNGVPLINAPIELPIVSPDDVTKKKPIKRGNKKVTNT